MIPRYCCAEMVDRSVCQTGDIYIVGVRFPSA